MSLAAIILPPATLAYLAYLAYRFVRPLTLPPVKANLHRSSPKRFRRAKTKSPLAAIARTALAVEDRIFTERRVGFYASGIAAAYVISVAWLLLRHGLAVTTDGVNCTDFTWIWLSSKLASSGIVSQIYDYAIFSAARVALIGPPNCVIEHFDYPPTLLLFTYPLSLMPYFTAFLAWIAATLLLDRAAVYAIIPRRAAVIAAVTSVPVLINVLLGHNGFLTAGLVGLALAFLERRRPWLAGIFLGLLTYKPQFGILFPLALLVSRDWRVILSAAATGVIFGLAAAIAFGDQAWPSFIDVLAERASSLNSDPALNLPLVSVLGFLLADGVNAHTAWTVQLTVTAIVALTVGACWAQPFSYPLKAATLAIGSVLAAPHAIGYDLCILSIAAAFLVKDGLLRGFLPGERAVMLICWVGLIVAIGPIPPIICVVLLALAARRAVVCGRETFVAPGPILMAIQR
jgi:arabinofuranan 3-O-arabinosyltransferase